MNWFDKLIQDALKDDYLNELIVKAENLYTINFFNIHSKDSFDLSEKEYNDLFVDGSAEYRKCFPFTRYAGGYSHVGARIGINADCRSKSGVTVGE